MKILSENKALRRRRFLRLNILAALFIFIISAYMVVTGDYASLQERRSADQLYNTLMIGSIIYMAAVWVSCVMTKPFWFPNKTTD
jgi:hypothetical protein